MWVEGDHAVRMWLDYRWRGGDEYRPIYMGGHTTRVWASPYIIPPPRGHPPLVSLRRRTAISQAANSQTSRDGMIGMLDVRQMSISMPRGECDERRVVGWSSLDWIYKWVIEAGWDASSLRFGSPQKGRGHLVRSIFVPIKQSDKSLVKWIFSGLQTGCWVLKLCEVEWITCTINSTFV